MARGDPPQITLDEIKTAATAGGLAGAAARLARERNWVSLGILYAYAGGPKVPLPDLTAAARAMNAALSGRISDTGDGFDGSRGARLAASEALLSRVGDPVAEPERDALRAAAETLADAGELRRAAQAFERAGEDARAADAFGAIGDIERMEACLQREEARRSARATAADAVRTFEDLLSAGEREAAARAAAAIPDGVPDAAAARALSGAIESRLCRGRAITLRFPGPGAVRFAGLPAVLGRDPQNQLVLRDPGVSRRHAVLSSDGNRIVLEDVGSRAGTTLAGLPLAARLPLPDAGEMGLGPTCRLSFRLAGPGRIELRGASGLDRPLLAFVSAEPLPLRDVAPEADGLRLVLAEGAVRLQRDSTVRVRVDGRFMGASCDLLHRDVIECVRPDGILRIEVE